MERTEDPQRPLTENISRRTISQRPLEAVPKGWKMKSNHRFARFVNDIITHTPIVKMIFLLAVMWLLFAAGLYCAEREIEGGTITSYEDALYRGIAAFSTAGIANTPLSGLSQIIGGIWIVLGSALYFGTIIATITTYFMRPLQRPVRQIVETIEYNLGQLDDLSVEELDLLKDTTDALIVHMERHKQMQEGQKEAS